MKNERLETYQERKNLEKAWKITKEEVWSERERECLGDEQVWTDRERSKKWEMDREESIYRPSVNLNRCMCREVSRKLSRKVSRKWSSTAEVSSNKESDPRTEARSIHQVSRSCWDCDKKNAWKARQIARYRRGVEEVSSQLFKTVFREEKNIDMNAIQHTTQPMIQSTQ